MPSGRSTSCLDTACAPTPTLYLGEMNTIHLTDSELEMARHAVQAYLHAFGHREAETVAEIKRVIAKLQAAQPEGEEPHFIA